MPYVTQRVRDRLEPHIEEFFKGLHNEEALFGKDLSPCPGNLNYVITRILIEYLRVHGMCYDTLCDIDGVLGDIAKEWYRRVVVPYEDKKIFENGDLPFPEIPFEGGSVWPDVEEE